MRGTLAVLLACGAFVALLAGGSASAAKPRLSVYFLRGEQVAPVTRPGATARDAVRALLRGPTRAERTRGFRTYVPRGIRIRSLKVAGGIATVDLNERFAGGRDTGSLLARLAELVRTLTGRAGDEEGAAAARRQRRRRPVPRRLDRRSRSRFRSLQTPNVPVPEPPPFRLPPPDPEVKALQQRLIQLGYMIHGDDDGRFGPATQNAILGFQKWERLPRTGLMDAKTKRAARDGGTPGADHPRRRREARRDPARPPGRPADQRRRGHPRDQRLEREAVDADAARQLPRLRQDPALVVDAVPRVAALGAALRRRNRLPPVPDVPAYPASHGCVRQLYSVARWTYNFAFVGMPVKVLARS